MDATGEGQVPVIDEPLLVERVRRGDREALGILVDRYSEQAFAAAYGFLQHAEDAEDLVQDAFIRALERIDKLGRGSNFGHARRRSDDESGTRRDTGRVARQRDG